MCSKSRESIFSEVCSSGYFLDLFDGFRVPYGFFKKSNIDRRVVYYDDNKKRFTQTLATYETSICQIRTKTSFDPNFIHSIDAAIVRLNTLYFLP
jgi:hypothetical protein